MTCSNRLTHTSSSSRVGMNGGMGQAISSTSQTHHGQTLVCTSPTRTAGRQGSGWQQAVQVNMPGSTTQMAGHTRRMHLPCTSPPGSQREVHR